MQILHTTTVLSQYASRPRRCAETCSESSRVGTSIRTRVFDSDSTEETYITLKRVTRYNEEAERVENRRKI